MANEQEDTKADGQGGGRGPRSPNFPAISLPEALQKAKILYEKDRRATVSVKTVLKHFGFGEKLSGTSARVISALRQFGLLDEVGGNYRVSESAFHILSLSDASSQKTSLIQNCAKKPAIYREVLARYEAGLPSDEAFADFLILEKKFNPVSVDNFIRSFRASMAFAKVFDGAYTSPDENRATALKVGDYVQWTSAGVDQFQIPPRITGITEDGLYVFVENTMTGLPAGEVHKVDAPPPAPPSTTPGATTPPLNPSMAASLIPPQNWVLSVPRGVKATLVITGTDVKPEDLRRLKAQIDFLADAFADGDDDENA